MGWQAHADDAGRIYYTNLITQESVWVKPTKPSFVSTCCCCSRRRTAARTHTPAARRLHRTARHVCSRVHQGAAAVSHRRH